MVTSIAFKGRDGTVHEDLFVYEDFPVYQSAWPAWLDASMVLWTGSGWHSGTAGPAGSIGSIGLINTKRPAEVSSCVSSESAIG